MNHLHRNRGLIVLAVMCSMFIVSCSALNMPAGKKENSISQNMMKPGDRFLVFENGIVLDKKNRLEWYSPDIAKLNQYGTRHWLSQLNQEDPGWRLPTRNELYDLNKNGRTYCKTLGLLRDVFWIQHYRAYDLMLNIDTSPDSRLFRHSLFKKRHDDDDGREIRAHILVARARPSN